MKRKYVYSLLALPILVFLIYFATLPSETRATFISEFKYRAAALLGAEPEATDGPKGLRSERPEEYGPQPGTEDVAGSEGNAEPSVE